MRHALLIGRWILAAASLVGCQDPALPRCQDSASPCQDFLSPRFEVGLAPRLAVFSPAAAEILERLEATASVVAVGKWVEFSDGIKRPQVGTFDHPNVEALLGLGVEAVVTTASVAGSPAKQELQRLGLEFVELETATLEGIFTSIRTLGAWVGKAPQAERLVQELQERLSRIAARQSSSHPVRALIALGQDQPLWVAGPGSYLDSLLRIAGGQNVAAQLESPFAPISLEQLLKTPPQVIFELGSRGPADSRYWEELLAPVLRHKPRVVSVPDGFLSVPGPRVAEMAEYLAGELQLARDQVLSTP